MEWRDEQLRRGVRQRYAPHEPPQVLSMLSVERKKILATWVKKDNLTRGRDALLKEVGTANIERAEDLAGWLLREGWISRKEKLQGGTWQWESLTWRNLDLLKSLLGVGSRSTREEYRLQLMQRARAWLDELRGAVDDEFLSQLKKAVERLEAEGSLKVETLASRFELLESLGSWCQMSHSGTRRDFALHAGEHTKSIGAADWKWLEKSFELESLGITHFIPVVWLAGTAKLVWEKGAVDLAPVRCISLPIESLLNVRAIECKPSNWWLIENRASYERQTKDTASDSLVIWMPGRPSSDWLKAIDHLLSLAPSALNVSADVDPAGIDIACTVGHLWQARGLQWAPHRMGVQELEGTVQSWGLNEFDLALLQRLIASDDVPSSMKEICEAMLAKGLKAEQEGWL